MKKLTLLQFAFIGLLAVTAPHVNAGSAVAFEPYHVRMASAYGGPILRESSELSRTLAGFTGQVSNSWLPRMNQAIVPSGPRRKGTGWLLLFLLPRNPQPRRKTMFLAELAKAGGVTPRIISLWHDSYEATAAN